IAGRRKRQLLLVSEQVVRVVHGRILVRIGVRNPAKARVQREVTGVWWRGRSKQHRPVVRGVRLDDSHLQAKLPEHAPPIPRGGTPRKSIQVRNGGNLLRLLGTLGIRLRRSAPEQAVAQQGAPSLQAHVHVLIRRAELRGGLVSRRYV